ncbi:Rieske 2Fe-2S domain-containing protein [Nonomuraea phyllanthi]|uniref:Cytochrome bc1 complex Rieske iron-sulfur subunit n=1 Tax=Nonomuraea phyllanthi TaxID=2219224 RepID=A0A5C4WUZ2_9ACTN|nr:Rieske 2Fe-2S domain-containing protein [Nonomuraea phyllanthi]KAB8197418.1 Rieske 2Fe-2S domain-containing protein [Nonomuraea phyllanthi]
MKRPERGIAAAFGVTVLGAVMAAASYVAGADRLLLGLGFALGFAGLAAGFVLWAATLLPQGPYVEEREPMVSPPGEREALEAEYDRPAGRLPRRMLALALGTFGLAGVFPVRSLIVHGPSPSVALATTAWRDGVRLVDQDGRPVRAADVTPGTMVTAFPEGHLDTGDSAAVVLRVDPAKLRLPAGRERWTVDGVVAFSKLCTHAGCPVGQYVAPAQQLVCPCHQSVFDVLRGAEPMSGPAARSLPQLPLRLDGDGVLVAAGDFPEPVGAGYWRPM